MSRRSVTFALVLAFVAAAIWGQAWARVFTWAPSPAAPTIPGITYELQANGVTAAGITGTSYDLPIPDLSGQILDARVRAVPPSDLPLACCPAPGCGDPPAAPTVPCWTASAWATLTGRMPEQQTNINAIKTLQGAATMTAPTFVAQYPTAFNTGSTPKTAISAGAVSAGDVLVGVAARESGENGPTLNLTEDGAGAWTVQDRYGTTSATVETLSATYVASAETLTVTAAATGGVYFGGNVVRFSGSDGVGAHAQASGSGSPSVTITTTQANSAIVVIVGDWNAVSGTQTFTSSGGAGSPTALTGYPGDAAHYGVAIAYYPDAGAAGSKTVGMSAPTGQSYSILAVEVKGAAAGGGITGFCNGKCGGKLVASASKAAASADVSRIGARTTDIGAKQAAGGVAGKAGSKTFDAAFKQAAGAVVGKAGALEVAIGTAAQSSVGSAFGKAGISTVGAGRKGILQSASSANGNKTATVAIKSASVSLTGKTGGKTSGATSKQAYGVDQSRTGALNVAIGTAAEARAGFASGKGGARAADAGAKGVIQSAASVDGVKTAGVVIKSAATSLAGKGGGKSADTAAKNAFGADHERMGSRAAAIGTAAFGLIGTASTNAGTSITSNAGVKAVDGANVLKCGARCAAVGSKSASRGIASFSGARGQVNGVASFGVIGQGHIRSGARSTAAGKKGSSSRYDSIVGFRTAAIGAQQADRIGYCASKAGASYAALAVKNVSGNATSKIGFVCRNMTGQFLPITAVGGRLWYDSTRIRSLVLDSQLRKPMV